jgi:hypothetical protein
MDPIVLSVAEKDPEGNEEALIDRDAYVIDPRYHYFPHLCVSKKLG